MSKAKLNKLYKKIGKITESIKNIQSECKHDIGIYSALYMYRSQNYFCNCCNKMLSEEFVDNNYNMVDGIAIYNKNSRIEIYKDTKKFVTEGGIDLNVDKSLAKKYGSDSMVEITKVNSNLTDYYVEDRDTVSALKTYRNEFKEHSGEYGRVCLLNMASAKKPGGGVENGAQAQEECLFRCSNLFNIIPDILYPIKEDELIYSENVTFFKDKNYSYFPDRQQFVCDVITIPAMNLNSKAKYDDLDRETDYEKITLNKIDLMLNHAYQNKINHLILGAFGCGVFKNDPTKMSEMFKKVIDEKYDKCFGFIEFAVINDYNSVGNNYEIFKSVLG